VADWFGEHRAFYVLFVLLFIGSLWAVRGIGPLRRLLKAWRCGRPVPHGLIRRSINSVGFGFFGVFLVAQLALASAHLLPASPFHEYVVWLVGGLLVPLVAQWVAWSVARHYLFINPIYDDENSSEARLSWRLLVMIAVALLSLPLTQFVGFEQPLGRLLPIAVLSLGGLWLWLRPGQATHG